MGSLSISHWLIVLIIVMMIFGTKKLKDLGSDLGGAVKGFKEGLKNEPKVSSEQHTNNTPRVLPETQKAQY